MEKRFSNFTLFGSQVGVYQSTAIASLKGTKAIALLAIRRKDERNVTQKAARKAARNAARNVARKDVAL